ncbi:MAG: LapA family protein [Sphingomicrobium sp.]
MLNFTTDQWVIIALIFVLGLLIGGFMFSGGGRKWRHKYNAETQRRAELERTHAAREKDWREQDSLRAAALKNQPRETVAATGSKDLNRDGVVTPREAELTRDDELIRESNRDLDGNGIPDRKE